MSLLTIIQGVLTRPGLADTSTPTTVIGNTDKTVMQCLALAQQEGKELARRAAWKALTTEQTFTTVATAAQTGALPSDLDWIVPETFFNRTLSKMVRGPLSAAEWQFIQSEQVGLINPAFRIRGTSLLMSPTPSAGDTCAFEYVTRNWCQSGGGTGQAAWAADTDSAKLDEELHILGIIWRFKKAKGIEFTDDFATYDLQVRQAILREGVRPRLSSDPCWDEYGGDAIAAARGNVILSSDGDALGWE